MSEKSRNFRSSYYDKVGFRSIEEKKSLEILMNEKPMDKEKLKKFCLRFILPSMYREYVWKVLLGVLPVNMESHDSILNQRQEHYLELERSLKIMFKLPEITPPAQLHVMMFLMTEDVIEFDLENMKTCPKSMNLIALSSFFNKLSSSDVVAYSLFKKFVLHQRKYSCSLKLMRESFETILRKEDEILYDHFRTMKILDKLPVCTWFEGCFTQVLHESSLARVFDKVISGSFKILPYVATALLVGKRHLLLSLNDSSKISEIFENISEDVSDVAVNKALDMLQFAVILERETEQYRSKNNVKS